MRGRTAKRLRKIAGWRPKDGKGTTIGTVLGQDQEPKLRLSCRLGQYMLYKGLKKAWKGRNKP